MSPHKPLKVGLRSYKIIAWVCVVFFLGCSIAAFAARQYGPSAFFWVPILMGAYMLVSAGSLELDEDGVSHTNLGGRYRIHWREVQKIEFGTQGSLVLHGEDSGLFCRHQPFGPGQRSRRRSNFSTERSKSWGSRRIRATLPTTRFTRM
jgi:hypothetical protein